ncbi:hypothetical protein [Albidovulum sp.]|uniref:hypothetical protein n=1 Tax=Albidovulum sp. TaxID=1872424 RepID=UPI002B6DD3B2|nr:hypothetical protein [Paracoccaceae bacterium]MCP5356082.1 hypothetical protein [Paracoccaceae bacterium]MCP5377385.1 hypothetical protein [Paracoccaceae bacterium]HPE26524.1 hypothetical protein [Albidovulum sp.]HRV63842.1 hypothetical protein [Albidovulum sp.]
MTGRSPGQAFDEALLLIGRLNYTWTNTESLLVHLIAGLARTDKDTAVILFLTLNTMRARVDVVERLAKLDRVAAPDRARILAATRQLVQIAATRNRYNHSIYAFDPESGNVRTILMRIADKKDAIKMGQSTALDAGAMAEIDTAIQDLGGLNREIWAIIRDLGYPQ